MSGSQYSSTGGIRIGTVVINVIYIKQSGLMELGTVSSVAHMWHSYLMVPMLYSVHSAIHGNSHCGYSHYGSSMHGHRYPLARVAL